MTRRQTTLRPSQGGRFALPVGTPQDPVAVSMSEYRNQCLAQKGYHPPRNQELTDLAVAYLEGMHKNKSLLDMFPVAYITGMEISAEWDGTTQYSFTFRKRR